MKKSNGTVLERSGHDALWLWFGLSRAGWLTLPRVMMHEMPDEWQAKMAELLNEWDETWKNQPDIVIEVRAKRSGKLIPVPKFLCNYRHPDRTQIDKLR